MEDDESRRIVIDRANRMLRQSKTLRKLADELLQESKDLRTTAKTRIGKEIHARAGAPIIERAPSLVVKFDGSALRERICVQYWSLEAAVSRQRLRTLACCAMLQMGTLLGIPMRPEQIQDLMRTLNEPKLASTNPDDTDNGEGKRGRCRRD